MKEPGRPARLGSVWADGFGKSQEVVMTIVKQATAKKGPRLNVKRSRLNDDGGDQRQSSRDATRQGAPAW